MNTIRYTTFPLYIANLPATTPKTADEARRFVQEQNARARRDREQREREHAAFMHEQAEQLRRLETAPRPAARTPTPAARAPRIDVAAIYAERNRPHRPAEPAPPAPDRPQTFAALAAERYGAPEQGATAPIHTSVRGGR